MLLRIVMSLCFFAAGAQAHSLDVKDAVEGKTFWSQYLPERYYFGTDGTFLLQATTATETHEAGAVREGAWVIGESARLCWTFKDEGIERCYAMAEDLLAPRPWYNYDHVYNLEEVGTAANIPWDRWMHGNLITRPAVYEAISEGKTPPLDIEAYKAAIVGKIMRLPLGYAYHQADGRAFFANEKALKRLGKNPPAVTDKEVVTETWTVENGHHCYHTKSSPPFCMIVFSGQDLYVPQEGWVQIMPDNFIRLIKPVDLMKVR